MAKKNSISNTYYATVGPHEDIEKFPNCLNSIPNENLGLKKENGQNFSAKMYGQKKPLLLGENCHFHSKISIFFNFT